MQAHAVDHIVACSPSGSSMQAVQHSCHSRRANTPLSDASAIQPESSPCSTDCSKDARSRPKPAAGYAHAPAAHSSGAGQIPVNAKHPHPQHTLRVEVPEGGSEPEAHAQPASCSRAGGVHHTYTHALGILSCAHGQGEGAMQAGQRHATLECFSNWGCWNFATGIARNTSHHQLVALSRKGSNVVSLYAMSHHRA